MANYYGKCRTNYISLADGKTVADFEKILHNTEWDENGYELITNNDGKVGFLGVPNGLLPDNWEELDEKGEDYDADYDALIEAFQNIIADGDALFIEEIGSEKYRYLVADVLMLTKDEYKHVSLNEVMNEFIKEKKLKDVTTINY